MISLLQIALCFLPAACVYTPPEPFPTINSDGTLNVAIVIMPGLFISEATIPFDVYKHVSVSGKRPMKVYFVAETAEVDTAFGTKLGADYTFSNAPTRTDILVVPSGRGSHHSFLTAWYNGKYDAASSTYVGETAKKAKVTYYGNMSSMITWVKSAASTAKLITSHCWGAFTLGDAGILIGKTVTTFPGYTNDLKKYYPSITSVVDNARFVVDGKVMTSVGGLGAFEACIYVVRKIYGGATAKSAGPTGLVYSPNNIGHSTLSYYKPSPAKTAGCKTADGTTTYNVGVLLLHGMFISEPVGPWDVFAHGIKGMTAFFVSDDMTPKITYYGAKLYPDYTFSNHPKIDILVVPSGIGSHWSFLQQWYSGSQSNGVWKGKTTDTGLSATANISVTYYGSMPNVMTFVKKASATATYVTSHCWGAFTLADAGILVDKKVTTFPGYGKDLEKYYPGQFSVNDKARIIRDGNIITSNGGVAAYEGPIFVLKLLYGECQAKTIATGLVYAEDNYMVAADCRDWCDKISSSNSCFRNFIVTMVLVMMAVMR